MRPLNLNEKGSVTVFFMIVLPLLIVFLLSTLNFGLQVFTKIKLQAALDRAVFVGGQVLTGKLNETARKNAEVFKAFDELQKHFKKNSKDTLDQARARVKNTKKRQERLYEEMGRLEATAYGEAVAEAVAVFQQTFPKIPLNLEYSSPFAIDKGTFWEFGFDEIKGVMWDPKDYKGDVEIFKVREAFNKNPQGHVALALSAKLAKTPSILNLFRIKEPVRAISAAQPYGGSIWHYAVEKENKERLYRTALVPVSSVMENLQNVFH